MRQIAGVFNPPGQHWVGDGFPVRSVFSPSSHGDQLDPFILLDHAGPHEFERTDSPRGVGAHPHRGFETVTIVYDGELEHRDSTGNGGHIGPGDVQWMTAASGIVHEEFHSRAFTEQGGTFEAMQLWVNLPKKDKGSQPGYQTLLNRDIPAVALPDSAGQVRVIAGSFGDVIGPAKTYTPINVWDLRLGRNKHATLALPHGHSVAVVVRRGTVLVNDAEIARAGQLVVFDRKGVDVTLEANNEVSLLVLSGEPIGEPVVAQGPFVMNSLGEIKQAMLDYRNGEFGAIA